MDRKQPLHASLSPRPERNSETLAGPPSCLKPTARERPMPDESPQETFPQEAAGRLHLPSSCPLPDSFPGRSGIGDVDLSRLPKPVY
ncbi:hypothetical protein T02_9520 [Trichinella nativa]|uniref:Uncharacterized protein n=1 Tax=Trichinella nativa TaxID=6335 RepID=A0A0V1KJH8_9BILA|nr:hypothetical protein T02_9520 [Trichinella nativa]